MVGTVFLLSFATIGNWDYRDKLEVQKAIAQVVQARAEAYQKASVSKKIRGREVFDASVYLKALHEIDTKECPKKFRLAWLDYVQAWDRQMEILPFLFEGVLAIKGDLKPLAEGQIARNTTEKWRAVQRMALEYGIDVPPEK